MLNAFLPILDNCKTKRTNIFKKLCTDYFCLQTVSEIASSDSGKWMEMLARGCLGRQQADSTNFCQEMLTEIYCQIPYINLLFNEFCQRVLHRIFTESARWADSVSKSRCSSVVVCCRVLCHQMHFF